MSKGKISKAKKTTIVRAAGGFGMKKVDMSADVRRIYRMFVDGDETEAYDQLAHLCYQYPDYLEANQLMANLALELDDMKSYGRACARLMQLQPKNANHVYGFAGTLMTQQHPLLTLKMMQQAIALDPDNAMADYAQTSIAMIEEELDDLLAPANNLPKEQAIEVLTLHEWAQVYLNWGDYEKCRETELQVLKMKPDLMAAMNNLSLVDYTTGDLKSAIAYSEEVLTIEPDNIHALSNLVRYCLLVGAKDRAKVFAEHLKQSQVEAWNPWTKKFEGLSCIGDDVGIIELWQIVKQDEKEVQFLQGDALHLVAVAMARQGEIKQAQELWCKALELSPTLQIAQENLNNSRKPIGQEHTAWPFESKYWITDSMAKELVSSLSSLSKKSQAEVKRTCQKYFSQHPAMITWIETMLDRGDPISAQMALELAKDADLPPLWEIIMQFALGQHGSDDLRNQAVMALVRAEKLDSEPVQMWLKGKWQKISLINYEFHNETPYEHSPKVMNLVGSVIALLKKGTSSDAIEAEKLSQQALAIKKSPDILNNLAVAYQLQNRDSETMALCRQIVADYPTYIPAKVTLAGFHMNEKELDQADALLKPVIQQKRIHIDDLATFSEGYLRLLILQDQIPAAQTWLQLWEQVTPDHSRIPFWHKQLDLLSVKKNRDND